MQKRMRIRAAQVLAAVAWLATAMATAASAEPWQTDDLVGPNQALFRLQISCTGDPVICPLITGYDDQRTSLVLGAGSLSVDDVFDEIVFATDSQQDVGLGLEDAYLTLDGTNLTFAGIPFYGIPEVTNVRVFSLSSPAISVPGLDLAIPGDYPFSSSLDMAGLGDVIGNLSLLISEIVVAPAPTPVTGTLRVLGDVDMDGNTEIEIADLAASVQTVQLFNDVDLGVTLTITVDADLDANLTTEVANPIPPTPVPLLGLFGQGTLAFGLGAAGLRGLRRRGRIAA